MNKAESSESPGLFIEISQSAFEAFTGSDHFSFRIEREANGRLTDLCRERLTTSLRGFFNQHARGEGVHAFCAIGARGVSMRRLCLPASSKDDLRRLLRLQIESEFPLSPDELAWGFRPFSAAHSDPARQDFLVVAVKKELLRDYASILAACGVVPRFTLAALARAVVYPPPPTGSCAILDVGRTHSELITFENGVPASIRLLAWGADLSLTALAQFVAPATLGDCLYVTGDTGGDIPSDICANGIPCKRLSSATGSGKSAAIEGLIKSDSPLIFELNEDQSAAKSSRFTGWKWAVAAGTLALGALLFPYAEAIAVKPFLERKLAALEADRGRLAVIDQELDFLKYLKQNQPHYLDAIYLMAKSAPGGLRLESLSMGRHQEIALRLKVAGAQQVSDFRSKLIESGWFTNVIVEEQTPSPDRRVTARMTAEIKPAEARKPLPVEPPGKKPHPSLEEMDFNAPPAAPVMMTPPAEPLGAPVETEPAPAPAGPQTPQPPRVRRIRPPTNSEP